MLMGVNPSDGGSGQSGGGQTASATRPHDPGTSRRYNSAVRLASWLAPAVLKRTWDGRRRAGTGRPDSDSCCVSREPVPYISTSISGKPGRAASGKAQPLRLAKKHA